MRVALNASDRWGSVASWPRGIAIAGQLSLRANRSGEVRWSRANVALRERAHTVTMQVTSAGAPREHGKISRRMLELFKRGPSRTFTPLAPKDKEEQAERFSRIRCPLCSWNPTPSTLWACESYGTPEPYFGGCGTLWNTFATRGKCPGCAHQWVWTSCPHCLEWSLHQDWYSEES